MLDLMRLASGSVRRAALRRGARLLFSSPVPAPAQSADRTSPGNSISMCCRCRGRRRSAPRRPTPAVVRRRRNAARGRIRSSCTGCGRNTTGAFRNTARYPSPRLYHGIVSSMLDLMPAPHLIFNEWDKHGTCSGLSAQAYFDTMRKARAAVKIPPEYIDLKEPLSRHARRGRRCFHQSQSRADAKRHRGRMRQEAVDRGPALSVARI